MFSGIESTMPEKQDIGYLNFNRHLILLISMDCGYDVKDNSIREKNFDTIYMFCASNNSLII